jgi:lipoprotein-anchoring transpeptidase ErfK/SrfK
VALARVFLIGTTVTFASIGTVAFFKKKSDKPPVVKTAIPVQVEEVPLATAVVQPLQPVFVPLAQPVIEVPSEEEALPDVDRISRLFALDSSKLPIVETLSYTSRVPWLKGRPAWLADYATYFATSRHFIARSLNRKPDYFTQKVSPGDRFNVFKRDKDLQFHLMIDLSRCKMWFYSFDIEANERVLLKTYRVGIGRQDAKTASGFLTPTGKYLLGNKIAIYKAATMGFFQENKIEMIRVFGTRWIPFDQEVENCSEGAKGFGIHGAPWTLDSSTGQFSEDRSKIGKYDSDGCIRLSSEDMEELFSIIITKPTIIEIVKDYHEARLPGVEKNL